MTRQVLAAVAAALAWSVPPVAAEFAPPAVASATEQVAADRGSEDGAELRVWLVTIGPGDAVWERYGHNAIRVLDTRTGHDISYNWGIFDFNQVDFIPRFLRGRMLYMMAPFPTRAMIEAYARADREVILQELDLTPSQKASLRDIADRNALPQNRDYLYQYFLDNCSTRVRDLLDRVLEGRLRRAFGDAETETSFRYHTRRLTEVDPLIYTGMDMLLGAPTDREITVWEEMFIPMTLRDALRDVRVVGDDGRERPLVLSEEVAEASSRPAEAAEPPSWFLAYLGIGLALGLLFASTTVRPVRSRAALRRGVVGLAVAWSLLAGVAGTILLLLLLTDHTFAYRNENLFLFTPLSLGAGLLLPFARAGGRVRAIVRRLVLAGAALALAGLAFQLLPVSRHHNAIFFALALPAHLGLAWAFIRGGNPGRSLEPSGTMSPSP